jgi:predicted DNA-binding antitoxin AbrB/MazE fold protein
VYIVSITVRARYEDGVLKPLQDVGLKEGEEVIIIIKRKPNIDKFVGVLGKASVKELEAYEEEVYAP